MYFTVVDANDDDGIDNMILMRLWFYRLLLIYRCSISIPTFVWQFGLVAFIVAAGEYEFSSLH